MSDWRFEKKIPLGSGDLQQIENILLSHPMGLVTAYPARIVRNAYFDSPDLACYRAHLAGHEARVKWRLRSYDGGAWKQLEEKRKLADHGDKRFYSPEAAIAALREGGGVVLGEGLMYPVIENRYHRRYYTAPAWGIRVTLDTNMEFTSAGKGLWQQDYDFVAVLEIKYDLAAAKLGADFVSCLPWRLHRFSKYVRGMQLLDIS